MTEITPDIAKDILNQFDLDEFADQMVEDFINKMELNNVRDYPIIDYHVFWDECVYKSNRIGWYGWVTVDVSKDGLQELDIAVSVDKKAGDLYKEYGFLELERTIGLAFSGAVEARLKEKLGIVNEKHQLD